MYYSYLKFYRRYGVVDNRFCFEGGSSCGKGEGLYIFVTDLGEEITHTIKLASKGNLSSKKRPYAKKLASIDSPKKHISRGPNDIEEICAIHTNDSINDCGCASRTSYWPSQESRDLDSNYGCGDTASVSEAHDSLHDLDNGFTRNAINNMERCMSCISKLGAMSRSSTITVGTPAGNCPPMVWTTISEHNHMHQSNATLTNKSGLDRMSLCSHGSSNNSDYSVAPRQTPYNTSNTAESWYEPAPVVQQICNRVMSPPPPDRPPKPGTQDSKSPHVGPYENYDIPKVPAPFTTENYDTPKKIQEYLGKDLNSNSKVIDKYGNYDTPPSLSKAVCGCLGAGFEDGSSKTSNNKPRQDCACTRIMSWTDNWICKRGNGIENTGIPVNKVKLTGEGKMPLMDASGESDLYATVDMAKKIKKRLETCECDKNESNTSNNKLTEGMTNYANFEFEKSLENYENAKEVLQRAGLSLDVQNVFKICQKCGHASKTPEPDTPVQEQPSKNQQQANYLMMKPGNKKHESCPGYVPMHPAGQASQTIHKETQPDEPSSSPAPPLPSKSDILKLRMNKLMGEKSASNPSLVGPAVDRSQKRVNDSRVPGSAMMVLARTPTSPYNRKHLLDSSDLLPIDKRLTARKRSSSADSSRFLENSEFMSPLNGSASPSTETLRKLSLGDIETRRSSSPCVHQESELCQDASCCATPTAPAPPESDEISASTASTSQNSQSMYIRRSESVPCKAQNRDSSSSNDSGVSTGSLRQRGTDFNEFELPMTTAMTSRRHQKQFIALKSGGCVHTSLPRRSKSFDPLRDLSFQFQRVKVPEKSTSAEAEVPICPPKGKGYGSASENTTTGQPGYVDSRSTSSGTSDMSDYIETLSLSSHSSSDAQENLRYFFIRCFQNKAIRTKFIFFRQIRQATSTLRPRSGKEYQNIDRSLLSLTQQQGDTLKPASSVATLRANYANITPVPENAESPSPGYQSGTSPQEQQGDHFMFKVKNI